MVFRGLSVLPPWRKWAGAMDVDTFPRKRLPTRAEMADLAAGRSAESPTPVNDRLMLSARSVRRFYDPRPSAKTRAHLHTWGDWGRYAFVWTNARLRLVENCLGLSQEWGMFSPNIAQEHYVTRATLVYADGSEWEVRGSYDPEDLTHYSRWFCSKETTYQRYAYPESAYEANCCGYCNLLAHRHPFDEEGRPLKRVKLFWVYYVHPRPGEDARAVLAARSGPPAHYVGPEGKRITGIGEVFYDYDVSSRSGKWLGDE
jgi:hypothetical protein